MNEKILEKLEKLELRSQTVISKSNQALIAQLPNDYIEFITIYNGGVGFIGNANDYIDLWTVENISELNPYFPEEEFSQETIIIGSDGSGTLYGYDLPKMCFFETDEYQMNRDEATYCGKTFLEFLEYLAINKNA